MNTDWQIIYPRNINEVKEYLENPKCHTSMVLYKQKDIMFLLNPFGSGVCNTQELKLSDKFSIDKIDLKEVIIINYGVVN